MRGQTNSSSASNKEESYSQMQCSREGHTNIQKPLHCNPVWSQQTIPNAPLGPALAVNRGDPQHAMSNKCQTMGLSTHVFTGTAWLQQNVTCTPRLSHYDAKQTRNKDIMGATSKGRFLCPYIQQTLPVLQNLVKRHIQHLYFRQRTIPPQI